MIGCKYTSPRWKPHKRAIDLPASPDALRGRSRSSTLGQREGSDGEEFRDRSTYESQPCLFALPKVRRSAGREVPLDPRDRVLDQAPRVEQVSRGLSDRFAPPFSGRERRTRDVLYIVLL